MAIELINVGATPNDGTGDPLRIAFEKTNNNFLRVGNTTVAAGPDGSIQFRTTNSLTSIAHFGSIYVSVGAPNTFFVSTDAENWNSVTAPTDYTINQVISTTTGFLAVGNHGTIISSLDGVSWTVLNSGVTTDLYAVNYNTNSGIFTAVGDNGLIITSPTGAVWTVRTSPVSNSFYGIASQTGQWVVVGDGGIVVASTDSINWTTEATLATTKLNKIILDSSYYYTVGDDGTIFASTDIITWNERTSGVSENLLSISAGTISSTNTLIAVGAGGTAIISTDYGLNWDTIVIGTNYTLNDTIFTQGTFWVVGNNGTIFNTITPEGDWTNDSIAGTLSGSSNLTFDVATNVLSLSGNIIPQANVSSALGTNNLRFETAYFGNTGVNIGDLAIRAVGTTLRVTDTGNANAIANITANLGTFTDVEVTGDSTLGNTATANYFIGDGRYLTNVVANSSGAAGSNTQVQFNDQNALGATANFTYDNVTDTLTVGTVNANIVGKVKVPFTYANGNINVALVPANAIVTSAQVFITTAFSNINATVSVGTVANSQQLFSTTDANINQVGSYAVIPNTKYNVTTQVVLFVSSSSSSVGEGLLILNYE